MNSNVDKVQQAFEYLLSWGRYDLTLAYLGPQMLWQVLRFDLDKGSFYNPNNKYPCSENPLMAAMLAIEIDEMEGYTPVFGSAIGVPDDIKPAKQTGPKTFEQMIDEMEGMG